MKSFELGMIQIKIYFMIGELVIPYYPLIILWDKPLHL